MFHGCVSICQPPVKSAMPVTALVTIIVAIFNNLRLVQGSGVPVGFVEAPQGIVYYPPPGLPGKIVRCRTNVTADIDWVSDTAGKLNPNQFNITKVSDTTSAMYLTSEFIKSDFIVGGTLTLVNLHCEAGGSKSTSFIFDAGELPEVDENPDNLTVTEKQSAYFKCRYKQTRPPLTVFTWRFKDRQNVIRTLSKTDTPGNSESGLGISSVMRSNAGTYACMVENEFGKAFSNPATLTVNYFGDVMLMVKPNMVVNEHSQITLECIVDSVPVASEIRLRHNDSVLFSSLNRGLNLFTDQVTVSDNNVTVAFTASRKWTGQLSCLGKNAVGNRSHSVFLTVRTVPDAPTVRQLDIVSSTHSVKYSWTLGKDGFSRVTEVSISCYSQNSTAIKNGVAENTIPPSILVGLIPGEEYQCSLYAHNSVGRSPPSLPFTVITQNAAPAKPVLGSEPMLNTMTSLQIHWRVNYTGGHSILKYSVHWKEKSSESVWNYTSLQAVPDNSGLLNQQGGTWSLMGLKPGTEYFLQITVTNGVGSNTSDIEEYATRACAPRAPSQPQIDDEVGTLNSIHLVLELPPDNGCGSIAGYIVRDAITRTELNSSYSVANSVVTIKVTGLNPKQEYKVHVYVVNENGVESEASERVEFKTTGLPVIEPTDDESTSGGLSMTIIAIIIAGGAVGVIILTIVLVLVCRHRRLHKKAVVSQNIDLQVNNARHMEVEYDHLENRPHPGPRSGSSNSLGRKSEFSDSDIETKVVDTVDLGFEQDLEQALRRKAALRKGSDDSSDNEALEGVIDELDEEINKLKLLGIEPALPVQKDGELSDTESTDLSTFV